MATAVRRSNKDGIAQCSMSRATLEATGHCHRATSCSVSPQRLPGQQASKQQSTNTPLKLAILMAMAMHRYLTGHIPRWRRSRASLEVTGRCHQASIMTNTIKETWLHHFFMFFTIKTIEKGYGSMLRLLFLTGGYDISNEREGLNKGEYIIC
jgi:hypothetical protein